MGSRQVSLDYRPVKIGTAWTWQTGCTGDASRKGLNGAKGPNVGKMLLSVADGGAVVT